MLERQCLGILLALREDRTMRRLAPVAELDKPAHMEGTYVDPLAWVESLVDTDSPDGGDRQNAE